MQRLEPVRYALPHDLVWIYEPRMHALPVCCVMRLYLKRKKNFTSRHDRHDHIIDMNTPCCLVEVYH